MLADLNCTGNACVKLENLSLFCEQSKTARNRLYVTKYTASMHHNVKNNPNLKRK